MHNLPSDIDSRIQCLDLKKIEPKQDEIIKLEDLGLINYNQFLIDLNSFNFNIFKLEQMIGRNKVLSTIGLGLLKIHDLEKCVNFDKFIAFSDQIYRRYNQNVQYHNDLHGSDTA